MKKSLKIILSSGCIIFFAQTSYSQTLPLVNDKSGAINAPDHEGGVVQGIPLLPSPQKIITDAEASVTVKKYHFNGNTVFSEEELQAKLVDSVGKSLNFSELNQAVEKISRFYRLNGYSVARAYLPAQKIMDGVIEVGVIEGRFSKINLTNTSKVSDEKIFQFFSRNLCNSNNKNCMGALIQDQGLERSILLTKDLPGTTVNASLQPGFEVGTSDLNINVANTKMSAYGLSFDNFGSPSTGVTRLNANIDINHLSDNLDQLSLNIATTTLTQTKTGNLTYILPLGYSGQRLGIAFSKNQYRLGAGYDATQTHGISNALSIFTSYPIIRTINNTLHIRISAEIREAKQNVDLIGASIRNNANVFRVGVAGDNVDDFGGGGYTVYSSTLSMGYVGSNTASDAAGAQSDGRFNKINYSVARQQTLAGPITLYTSLNGQYASKNLDGSEQTGLGGPTSVRGYGGEAGGSSGANGTIELRYTNPIQISNIPLLNVTYGIFVDRGWIQYYQTVPLGATPNISNTRALSSYGLSLTLQSQDRLLTSPTAMNYFLRAMIGVHSMVSGQTSAVEPSSRGKFWIQGGVTF